VRGGDKCMREVYERRVGEECKREEYERRVERSV
jgi:hypothetical protein